MRYLLDGGVSKQRKHNCRSGRVVYPHRRQVKDLSCLRDDIMKVSKTIRKEL